MKHIHLPIATIGLVLALTTSVAASPFGTWLRASTGGKISAYKCGGGLGLKVIASKDKAKIGKTIMCGAKPSGANGYSGSILNLEDGNTYSGKVQINGNTLDLSGCVLGGLICKTETWTRVK